MRNSPIVRVQIPDVATSSSRQGFTTSEKIIQQNTSRIASLQQAIGQPSNSDLESTKYASIDLAPTKVDGLVNSVLQKFPLNNPVTIAFASCKTDGETDKITADVASRLADRQVGKILLVDANPNSQTLSESFSLNESAGIGNVVCDDASWQSLVQPGATSGLDFLPYGTANTAKTLRHRTAEFLKQTKEVYQFICVSVGLNESAIAKSISDAADGIYLLVDLNRTSHLEAKAAADKFKVNNQPLIGCIALDATQES